MIWLVWRGDWDICRVYERKGRGDVRDAFLLEVEFYLFY